MSQCETLKNQGISLDVVGDELRLSPKEKVTAEVLQFAKTHKQEIMAELSGERIVWRNPYPLGTPEARRESLMQCMEAVWQPVFENVRKAYEGKQQLFKDTPYIRALEQRIEALQQAVLKGEAKLADFSLVVDEWRRAATAELN